MSSRALVLLSGGQDSTTCLYWSLKQFDDVEVVTFDYGQRHQIELESAKQIAIKANVPQKVLSINTFTELGGNALVDDIEVESQTNLDSLPNTFVPGRNLIFITFASAFAYQKKIKHIVTGVCETDYSGYPDCRDKTMKSLEETITLGMDYDITIHTPLMFKNKAEIWAMAHELGCFDTVLNDSHSCYNGIKGGCGQCPACELREKGLRDFYSNR